MGQNDLLFCLKLAHERELEGRITKTTFMQNKHDNIRRGREAEAHKKAIQSISHAQV